MNTVKLEVEISLEDFFNSDAERDQVFKQALNESLQRALNQSEFVQKNIAYYLFSHFKDEVFKTELAKIENAIREKIQEFKEPDRWDIRHNSHCEKIVENALKDISDEIYAATQKMAREMMADDNRDYNSIYGKVSDAMVDKVFTHFVNAMVDKENSNK